LFEILSTKYKIQPAVVESDNEIGEQKPRVREWIEAKGIRFDPSAVYT